MIWYGKVVIKVGKVLNISSRIVFTNGSISLEVLKCLK
jgi:hypothetical protein